MNVVLTSTLPLILITVMFVLLWASNSSAHVSAQSLENEDLTIEYLYIFSEIKNRYARTRLLTQIKNTSNFSILTNFTISMPKDAFATDFAMETDGLYYKGYIAVEDIAQVYACNSLSSNDAFGYIKDTSSLNRFGEQEYAIVLNIPGNRTVNANFTYDSYVEKIEGPSSIFSHKIRIIPTHAKFVKAFKALVNITEFNLRSSGFEAIPGKLNIGKYYGVPSSDTIINPFPFSSLHVHSYEPNSTEVDEMAVEGILGVVKVQYTLDSGNEGRNILVRDGYFVHKGKTSISPETLPRHVIFVLDISSSMLGNRIEHLRAGMKRILSLMLESSKFSSTIATNNYIDLITFSANATVWEPLGPSDSSEPLILDKNLMNHAINYIDNLVAAGSSNIYEALMKAISIGKRVQNSENNYPPSIILLITDGEPTSGIVYPFELITELEKLNGPEVIPIYSLTFGSEADYDLCRNLSINVGRGFGLARKIYENLNASNSIFEFYKEITSPSLQNVTFEYTNSFESVKRLKHETIRVYGSRNSQNLSLIIDSTTVDFRYINSNAIPCGEKCVVEKLEVLSNLNNFRPLSNITNFCIRSYNNPRSKIQRQFTRIIDLALKYDLVTKCTSLIANKASQFRRKLENLPLFKTRSLTSELARRSCAL